MTTRDDNDGSIGCARCVVMRGGTTRAVFFHLSDLPGDAALRDAALVAVVGGSDPRQVDGLGGADPLLSKVALVWPSQRAGIDVDCRFGTITPASGRVKYGANCGNLSSAVACFARQEGLVAPDADCVRLHNPDSGTTMEARWRPWDRPLRERLRASSGMRVTGELVELTFLSPAATATQRLLPTGRPVDCLAMPDGRRVPVSIVDAGALYVFLRAEDVDLAPGRSTDELRSDPALAGLCEDLRGQAAVLAGLLEHSREALARTPAVPKLAFVRSAETYPAEGSALVVGESDVDLRARIVSSQSFHKAYAVTGAIATAAAAAVPGSVVASVMTRGVAAGEGVVRIGHPSGIIECAIDVRRVRDEVSIERATVLRTARRLMEGRCLIDLSAA